MNLVFLLRISFYPQLVTYFPTNKTVLFNEVLTLSCPYFRFYQVLYTTKDKAFSFRRCKPSLKTYRLVKSFISVYFLDDIVL